MIGLFADERNTDLVNWVRDAARHAGLSANDVQVIAVKYDRDYHIQGRKHGSMIRNMEACIIDVSYKGRIGFAVRLGSISGYLKYETGDDGYDDDRWMSPLDSRIALLIRSDMERSEISGYFGDYYTTFSIEHGFDATNSEHLATWLRDTVSTAAPKVFVSYRSSQRTFAKTVAERLKERSAAVWFDEWDIQPGDSIPEAINRGLGWCTHLVLIVDEEFFDSKWASAEFESVLYRHLSHRIRYYRGHINERPIIPLFLVDPADESLPPMLARIRGIDCRDASQIDHVIDRLWTSITTIGPR